MDRTSQASFIPKKPASSSAAHGGRGVVLALSFILFLVSSASAGIVYFWNKTLIAANDGIRADIENRKDQNYLEKIKDLKRLSQRIGEAKTILDSHISVSEVFDILEGNTLKSIRFNSLQFESSNDADGAQITLNGSSRGYESIAYQSDVFSKARGLHGPVFSDLGVAANGEITFKLTARVDKSFINYGKLLEKGSVENTSDTSGGPSE